ncbi:MAG: hypothetical protein J6Y32_01740 [Bacteroidales bacterium]|nr:hypothetical protein [Bacteroidales bacterium]
MKKIGLALLFCAFLFSACERLPKVTEVPDYLKPIVNPTGGGESGGGESGGGGEGGGGGQEDTSTGSVGLGDAQLPVNPLN